MRLLRPLLSLLCLATLAAPPNILFIIDDDMGVSDLGCYGSEIETPHLDGLAKTGVRFTNYYVHNMCWPTRASLMTSLYPKTALRNGSAAAGLHKDAITLPAALKKSGYRSYMSGKWHLSSADAPDGPNAPQNRGFDHFYGTINGASDFFSPNDLQLDGQSMVHEWQNNPDYYYTDAITDYALRFLDGHFKGKDAPFFLYVAYTSAHWPLHAKPADIAHYKGRYSMGWDALREQRHARMKSLGVVDPSWPLSPRNPQVPAWEDEPNKAWQERRMEVYAAQVTCMDRNIGRIIANLKARGEYENTLIVYQHDNGACHVEYGKTRKGPWTRAATTDGKSTPIVPGSIPDLMPGSQATFQSYGYGWANAGNTPYRLYKQYDHEGGTRSPLIISWPEAIPSNKTGGLIGDVCHVIDIMPSLLEAAGAPAVQQKPMPMEGRSFLPAIRSGATLSRSQPLFWQHGKGKAVRDGDWKLVSTGRKWELYNLTIDGVELNNLADQMPERVTSLSALHNAWAARTDLAKKNKKKK
jgi:arylsulfatase A-like enzyme